MKRVAALWAAASLTGCAPALVVTASAALPSAAAISEAKPAARSGDEPDRDPQARGLARDLLGADVPDDRDGRGLTDALESCADPPADRAAACRR